MKLETAAQMAAACPETESGSEAQDIVAAGPWFAVQVRVGGEHNTNQLLLWKGYETLLAVEQPAKPRAARPAEAPLFPGYVFCRVTPCIGSPILTTPGVIRIVGVGATPTSIPESEIESVRAVMRSGLNNRRHAYLCSGRKVRVHSGPLAGAEGVVVSWNSAERLVISVSLLQRSISVEVLPAWLTPCAQDVPNAFS